MNFATISNPQNTFLAYGSSSSVFLRNPQLKSITRNEEKITTESNIPLDLLYSGQYHEVNPGQYTEINPGQYHEINPGQYHPNEVGQYYEQVNPGHYDQKQLGQTGRYHNLEDHQSRDYEVDDVKVDFEHNDNHKTYTVEAKAGDFIIGEVGRIDVNNGQTLEGVRYTALDGEVSEVRISQILKMFFGARSRS